MRRLGPVLASVQLPRPDNCRVEIEAVINDPRHDEDIRQEEMSH